jgi:hypothetical protein
VQLKINQGKTGQQLATISRFFSAMLFIEDCVQNVSDVGE